MLHCITVGSYIDVTLTLRPRCYINSITYFLHADLTLIIVDTIGIFIPLIVESVVKFDTGFFRALRILKIFRALRALRILRTIRFDM